MRVITSLILTLLLPCLLSAQVNSRLETRQLTIIGHHLLVEVADTPVSRSYGLMNRTHLDANAGMLFVFPDEDYRSFYMKNTLIPLSIAYIDKDGVIIEIYDMQPQDLRSIRSRRNTIMYALELKQGRFKELAIYPGMRVENLPPASQY